MYLNSLNYFRGIAMIFIVAGHCFETANYTLNNFLAKFICNFFEGGSTLFVFISGFLFHHIFYRKFEYQLFLYQKVKNVLLPYLIMSVGAITYLLLKMYFYGIEESDLDLEGKSSFLYIKTILFYLVTGKHIMAYWYVPFIMVLFTTSPLHVVFIKKIKTKYQLIISIVLLIVAMLIHRPTSLSVYKSIHALFYFTPVYLLGIICSKEKEFIYKIFKGKDFYLFILFLCFVCFQILMDNNGNSFKNPFTYKGFDIMIVQKLILSLFFMVFLHRFEKKEIKLLSTIANTSFGIFFIHGYVLFFYNKFLDIISLVFLRGNLLSYTITVFIAFFTSLIIVLLLKKILKNKSRMIIGA